MRAFLNSKRFLGVLTFLGLAALVILVFLQKIDLTVVDLGRHLNNGRAVWTDQSILTHNAYSYTEPDFPFINHHWFYGVIVYSVYRLTGFAGLSIMNILIALAAFSAAFFAAKKKIGLIGASLLSLPVIVLMSERVEIRPEIFSYLFIIFTYLFLESVSRSGRYRRLWLLAPFFMLWANIHIYFFIGLIIVFLKAAAVFLDPLLEKGEGLFRLFRRDQFAAAWKAARPWVFAVAVSVIACLANPNFWRGLAYPFNIFRNYGYEIAENKSVFFLEHLMADGNFCLFKFILAIFVISWALYFIFSKDRLGCLRERLFDIFLSLMIAGLALFASRNIVLFGLFGLMIMADNLAPVKEKFKGLQRYSSVFMVAVLLAVIFISIRLARDARLDNRFIKNPLGFGLQSGNEGSAVFFKEHNLQGPIFNNYDIGSALIFWLYGWEKVFVDNRPEAYSSRFFSETYIPMQSEIAVWEKNSAAYGFKTIYFSYTDSTPWAQQFLARIMSDEDWRLVYADAYDVILIKASAYSPEEVEALSLNRWTLKARIRELAANASVRKRLRLADLARLAGLPELSEEIYREISFSYPDRAQVLYSMASLYAGYGDKESMAKAAVYYLRAIEAGLCLPGVYNSLGLAYWNLGDYEKAEGAWHSALKRERKNSAALYYLEQLDSLKRAGKLPLY